MQLKATDGDYLTEEMSLAEIKAVEATSKAKEWTVENILGKNGAIKQWLKRASKYWPKASAS